MSPNSDQSDQHRWPRLDLAVAVALLLVSRSSSRFIPTLATGRSGPSAPKANHNSGWVEMKLSQVAMETELAVSLASRFNSGVTAAVP